MFLYDKCRICGCTQNNACITNEGPCWWVGDGICSACDDKRWMEGMANKFCGVFKHEDAVKYLNDDDKAAFNYLCHKIEMGRKKDGKIPVNAYLVINVDESYAEEVAKILKHYGDWG